MTTDVDRLVDACVLAGVVLLPNPETGCSWIADPGALEPEWTETLRREGARIGAALVNEPVMIGAALHLLGNRPGVVEWLTSLGHDRAVVEGVAAFHSLPALADDEPPPDLPR